MMTSVLDLSFLVVISLMTLGGMLSLMQRFHEPADGAAAPLPDLRAARDDWGRQVSALEYALDAARRAAWAAQRAATDAESEIATATREQARVEALLLALRAQQADLERRLAEQQAQEADWQTLLEVLGERGAERRTLEQTQRELVHRVGRLQERLTALQDQTERTAPAGGGEWVQRAEGRRIDVLVARGAVFPIEAQNRYIEVMRMADGVLVKPSGPGLTVEQALTPGSALLVELGRQPGGQKPWVLCIVDPDSFAAFRALRQGLAARRTAVGWEPTTQGGALFGPGGREVGPHGRR